MGLFVASTSRKLFRNTEKNEWQTEKFGTETFREK